MNYYNELKTYYDMFDRYFNLNIEMTEEEENELISKLKTQEEKVVNMLIKLMNYTGEKKNIWIMIFEQKDKLLDLMKKYK